MPRAVFSFTNNNPFYYKQSSAVKTIAAKFKQQFPQQTYCHNDRSTALTLLNVLFQANSSMMLKEPIKVGESCDFSDRRKA